MLLQVLNHLGVEKVLYGLFGGHVLRMLLFLLHGASMNNELDLCTLIQEFGSEEKCRTYLEKLRWPKGIHCPSCDSDKISRIAARNQFDCDACRYQFSATAGTNFHDTPPPPWKGFFATYLLCEARQGISADPIYPIVQTYFQNPWYFLSPFPC